MMKKLSFITISDPEECEQLWEEFSPKQELADLWKFRYTRFKYQDSDLAFLVGKDGDKIVGIFPLQWSREAKEFHIFGSANPNQQVIWLLPGYKNCYKQFYDQLIDKPAEISIGHRQYTYQKPYIVREKPKYVLPLEGFEDLDDYMNKRWRPKDRKKTVREMNRLERNYRVEVKQSTRKSLDKLAKLNIQRFGESSVFFEETAREMFYELTEHFETDFLIVKINGRIEAVGFSIIYNNTYYGINSASNRSINNLGKYLYLQKIQRAMNLGLEVYHAGRGNYGNWKTTFGFEPVAQHCFRTVPAK